MKMFLKVIVLSIFAVSSVSCQTRVVPHKLMELNRTGKWEEVKKKSISVIDKSDIYTVSEICEIYFQLIYSEIRLGENTAAHNHIKELDSFILENGLPVEVLWVEIELDKLKTEVGY